MKTQTIAQHTPAPWRAQLVAGPGHWQIINESCRQLALARHWPESDGVNSDASRAETEANARLIAAAPDLLAALRDVMSEADFGDPALAAKCRNAIARAEGNA